MAKKAGRARCGNCERVLEAPLALRQPTPDEQRQIDQAGRGERGRLISKYNRPLREDLDNRLGNVGAVGKGYEGLSIARTDIIKCRACTLEYRPADYMDRVRKAAALGQDLWLTKADLRSS